MTRFERRMHLVAWRLLVAAVISVAVTAIVLARAGGTGSEPGPARRAAESAVPGVEP